MNISFVIPVYNEQKRLKKTHCALLDLNLPKELKLEEIIFVNDGSTDRTEFQISNFKFQIEEKLNTKVRLISYPVNRGKGYAIKQGMLASNSPYTIFFDADISTPLSELSKLVPFMQKRIPVIVGTRKNGKSTVLKHQPKVRELLGRSFTKITKIVLGIEGTDFTCGFKAFSNTARRTIFSQTRINGWSYDAEIIFLAKKYKLPVSEKAVIWSNDENTKVTLYKAIPQSLRDLLVIQWSHSVLPAVAALLPFPLETKAE